MNFLLVLMSFYFLLIPGQPVTNSKVDFDAYEKLMAEVKEHRKSRLVDLPAFLEKSKQSGVIILDARSDSMYNSKHLKGAAHLNFSDFTQENLGKIIPSFDTEVLIYCNNNFKDDQAFFPTKSSFPGIMKKGGGGGEGEITLALNIPTYINLYGYGYNNVYELSELISVNDLRVEFEGTSVK